MKRTMTVKIETEAKYKEVLSFIEYQLLEKQNYGILINAKIYLDEDEYLVASLDFEPENADAYQYMLEILGLCNYGENYGLTLTITNF